MALAGAALLVLATPQPAAAQPAGVPAPEMTLEPAGVSAVQEPDQVTTHALTVGNAGGADLEWRVVEGEPRSRPTGPATPVPPAGEPDGSGPPALAGYRGHTGRPGWTVTPQLPATPDGAVSITHSDSHAVVAGASIACSPNGITTSDAGYLRHFTPTDFAIVGAFEVTSVSFGVESLSPAGAGLAVNLYTLADPAAPFDYHNFDLIGTAGVTAQVERMTIVEVPVSGTVPAGATLVVEVASPDLSRGGFFVGAGPAGQTAPSYLRAGSCGLASPTPTAALGLPELQLVMSVTGIPEVASCDAPGGTPWVAVDPPAGTVPAGESQPVEVTFDSAGLADGDLLAVDLCLVSNDPASRSVLVPLTLSVVADGGCDRTIDGVHPGPLTVTEGVTCLAAGARVGGEVNVLDGAGLVATGAVIQGPVATFGATTVELSVTQVTGPVAVRGSTGTVAVSGSQVIGSVMLVNNTTGDSPIVVSGNTIVGSLFCTGNRPAPVADGLPNTVVGGLKLDQCADL